MISISTNFKIQLISLTLNPSSPGFSASKSYNAEQHGPLGLAIGVRAGDLIGDGRGDAIKTHNMLIRVIITNFLI